MDCKKCGNPTGEGEVCEACKLVEQTEIAQNEVVEKVREQQPAPQGLSEEISFSAKKVASICAIFAPICVALCNALSEVSSLFQHMPYSYYDDFYNYDKLLLISGIISTVFCLINIAIYFVTYMLFTKKHREKLPIWLFVIAPGVGIFVTPFLYMINFLQNDATGLFIALHFLLAYVGEAVIAYFISRAIFIKLLSNKTNN